MGHIDEAYGGGWDNTYELVLLGSVYSEGRRCSAGVLAELSSAISAMGPGYRAVAE